MTGSKGFLDGAYTVTGPDSTRDLYKNWAKTYEDEVLANGYVTPQRCTAALSRFAADKTAPLLDIGCGSGLSGLALRAAGFTTIDGTDFSPEMLALAAKKTVYRALIPGDVSQPLPTGMYHNAAAIGVFSPGHAPAAALDSFLEILPSGGCLVFSLNDHAMADPAYQGWISWHIDTGTALLLQREYGDHLPRIGMGCTVYVLQKR